MRENKVARNPKTSGEQTARGGQGVQPKGQDLNLPTAPSKGGKWVDNRDQGQKESQVVRYDHRGDHSSLCKSKKY